MWSHWWSTILGAVIAVLLVWTALIAALWFTKPDGITLRQTMRLLPDILRLLKRLATDRSVPRAVRVWLAVLFAYLALPIDVVPDFIPVIGYADDAIIVGLVLRYVTRKAGPDALDRHWPGTPEGLAALRKLCRLP